MLECSLKRWSMSCLGSCFYKFCDGRIFTLVTKCFSLSDDADTKNAAEEIGGPVALEVFIFTFWTLFCQAKLG